ncbi:aminoglycoside phosphotransferase family protein [Paenibacillus sp. N4]|uniref:phosphotransferase n=1 Tax=Paenibacillus vietnamensis TaxID=2590547 RepID=UPI001CD104E2|nr:phosphotransferase [Paenibacillus vietnamensis]MCA0756628.1 aminoglycoside phosphotransferase family protein [Paenibacillus vietnamensis]
MPGKDHVISQVVSAAGKTGLTGVQPSVLSDGGNLIVHMAPYPIVARAAIVHSKNNSDHAYKVLERELRVARHLQAKGVPALQPAELPGAGPYGADGIWMTFWNYVSSSPLKPPSPKEAAELVNGLSNAMQDFGGEAPRLGVWERACESAERLRESDDARIRALLEEFRRVDHYIRHESGRLIPCHGDAHSGNLLAGRDGWLWMDFEDVSLMPAYWDLASYVSNLALFGGVEEPAFKYVLEESGIVHDRGAFGAAVAARILMSTIGNLDFALRGHGDMAFASRQLEIAGPFLRQLDLVVGRRMV